MNRRLTSLLPSTSAALREALARRYEIDLRALAVFRMALGALLLVDLVGRSRSLAAFYTDAGVLPRDALGPVYSLHAISGEARVQVLLFLVAGVFAAGLLIGYHTRIATAVSTLLLFSLHNRNPLVNNAGDTLLVLLLLLAVFLPLGRRWAIDARRVAPDRDRTPVASVATLAVLLQVLAMYVTNASHKSRGELWLRGDAVAYVMQADQYTALLGNELANYPTLLEWLTVLWMVLLFCSPLLLVSTGRARAVLVTLFVGMHLGMALTMQIMLFPLVAIAGLLLFYPPVFWDGVTTLAARSESVSSLREYSSRGAAALSRRSGRSRLRSVFAVPAGRSDWLRRRVPWLETGWRLLSTAIPALFVVLLVLSNAATISFVSTPAPVENALETADAEQNWRMFAPKPVTTTRWYVAPGTLANGSEVDVLTESAVDFDRPPNVERTYRTGRWRKYLAYVRSGYHRTYFADYLCERWNRRHDTPVETVSLWGLDERSDPYNATSSRDRTKLVEYDCDGPLVQS